MINSISNDLLTSILNINLKRDDVTLYNNKIYIENKQYLTQFKFIVNCNDIEIIIRKCNISNHLIDLMPPQFKDLYCSNHTRFNEIQKFIEKFNLIIKKNDERIKKNDERIIINLLNGDKND